MKKEHNRRLSKWSVKDRFTLGAMLSPFLIAFLVFMVIPVAASIVLSFFRFDMLGTPEFIGFDNYFRMIMEDKVFGISLANTLYFAVITGPVGFMLSFLLAWFINELGPKARSVLSFLFYSPALMGNVYFIWQVMFSGDSYGYVNSLLISLNVISEPIQWFSNPNYSMTLVILIQLWMSMGVSFLANISGLQNVDPTIYEAAAIDGVKNRWQELWFLTLPSMKNILLFSAVMQIQASFSVSGIATTLTGNPSVNYSTHTIVTHLTDVSSVRYEMGYAAAISVFLFLMMAFARIGIGKLLDATGK
ncbi:MAG: sugar ABC transporter permease [Oscillospiraceae bacterium]|nr:sugar ABC transporter permease [Oscillospiraceae bacterium]